MFSERPVSFSRDPTTISCGLTGTAQRDALREFDAFVAQIESGDTSRRADLELLFAPTGSIQEVSVSSGWGDEFLAVSERFDAVIKRV